MPETGTSTSRAEDYLDIFIAPSSVFGRRQPRDWVQPFLVLIAALVAVYLLTLPAQELHVQARMQADPEAAAAVDAFTGMLQALSLFFLPIRLTFAVLLLGAWLTVLARLLDIPLSFHGAMLIVVFARFVAVAEFWAESMSLLIADQLGEVDMIRDQSFGVLRFLNSAEIDPILTAVLDHADVFFVWQAVLWVIGVRMVSETEWGEATAAGILLAVSSMLAGLAAAALA